MVAEGSDQLPFPIKRIFTLHARRGAERGKHAHRQCSQLMLCTHGSVDIVCDDGREQRVFPLDRNNKGLLVPPMIWSIVGVRSDDAALLVLCDRLYEEEDYIRDHCEFVNVRKAQVS